MIPFLADSAPATFNLPMQAAHQAANVDGLFYFIYLLCVISFVGVCVAMVAFAWSYRRQPGVEADQSLTHNLGLELGWTIPPTLLVVVIFYWGFTGFIDMRTPPADAYKIEVKAKKWDWAFVYPNGAVVPGMDGLHVPAETDVMLVMESDDVLHSFYVPDFRVKQDVVPGRFTTLWFTAFAPDAGKQISEHRIFCAEYCGTNHSRMWSKVVVHRERADFDAWLAEVADPRKKYKTPEALGEFYYTLKCASCHNIDGSVSVGPPFNVLARNWGKEHKVSEGGKTVSVTADVDYIKRSVMEPNAQLAISPKEFAPGMSLGLGEGWEQSDYEAIAAFIKSLGNK